jgi:molybdopterin-guanine dinucleotide biosynthesis protein MobB
VRRVHIIGRKNSGKTTLIVELVEHWTSQGHRIGTIKHTSHRHELDTPGKDSHRHRMAGAAAVGIISPHLQAIFLPATCVASDVDPYTRMVPLFADCELVLVEGNSQTSAPKIEVWRAACGEPPLACSDGSIHALITNDPVAAPLPVWPRGDLAWLANHIWQVVMQ